MRHRALAALTPLAVLLAAPSAASAQMFMPQNEFKLDPWLEIRLGGVERHPGTGGAPDGPATSTLIHVSKGMDANHLGGLDLSITKGVFYLLLASLATILTMVLIARKMEQRPNRTQTAIEWAYTAMRDNIAGGNMERAMATKWFVFIATLFLFIWFSNMVGYFPLPTNTEHPVMFLGLEIPSFALYAATANISVPLVLALIVWLSYQVEGVRAKGVKGYLGGLVPDGVAGFARVPIFGIEILSQFLRIISLSVRLFANMLAGHLLILFMGGGLAVILGYATVAVITLLPAVAFYIFEVGLVVTLQAFIFATLSAIYLGEAVEAEH